MHRVEKGKRVAKKTLIRRSWFAGALLVHALSAAWGSPAGRTVTFKTTDDLSPQILEEFGDPDEWSVVVMKDARGGIGAYHAVRCTLPGPLLDSPVVYFDADGQALTVFHVFGPDAEKKAATAIIDALTRRFPVQEDLPPPQNALPVRARAFVREPVAGSLVVVIRSKVLKSSVLDETAARADRYLVVLAPADRRAPPWRGRFYVYEYSGVHQGQRPGFPLDLTGRYELLMDGPNVKTSGKFWLVPVGRIP